MTLFFRVIDGSRTVQNSSWLNTEDTVRMADGKFEILNEN